MTPTPKLRFVVRYLGCKITVRVLQQWWEDRVYEGDNWFVEGGEWRDVPLEEET